MQELLALPPPKFPGGFSPADGRVIQVLFVSFLCTSVSIDFSMDSNRPAFLFAFSQMIGNAKISLSNQ